MNMKAYFDVYWHGYGTNSVVNRDSWSSIYGLGSQNAESSAGSNSKYGAECVKRDRAVARATFDAMEMQSVPVCEAFHEGCFVGGHWQMPSMQKHRV
jgi:hypothetical protein